MSVCQNTGLTVPECSCRACLQALIDENMPAQQAARAQGRTARGLAGVASLRPRSAARRRRAA
jgi:hypothetical protein